MTKVNLSFPNFSGGEISPKMYGRFDLAAYYSGARRMENFIPQTVGAAHYRTGTRYVARTAGNNKAFLYTFKYTDAFSFALEFTDQKVRFYRDGGQVREDAQAITNVTQANPAVVTYSGADNYSNGDSVYIEGVEGMTELNGYEFTVANVNTGANTFELSGVDSSAYTAYTSGGEVSVITEVTTPYLEADLFELKFAQNGVDLYIAHPSYNPRKLTFSTATSWTLANHSPITRAFSASQNITNVTQANPAVVTYDGDDNFTNGDKILIENVSGMFELNNEFFTIANVNTGANTFELSGIDSTSYGAYTSGGTVKTVTESPASFLSSNLYPSCVTFYEDRLIYAGSNNLPQTMYFSKPADPDVFTVGTNDDDGITYTVSGDGNTIQWLRGTSRFLSIGTFGDVLQATGGIDNVITPSSISIRPSNSYGVADINPVGRGNQIFYVQQNKLILRSFEYDFESDGYIPVDRNTIADHITNTGITQITFQEGRPNVLWCTKVNGELIGMTIEDTESISGWHRHSTQGEIVSVAATTRQSNYNQLWMCVKRGNEYFIEYLIDESAFPTRSDYLTSDQFADTDKFNNLMYESQKDYVHVDSALTYNGLSAGSNASATLSPAALTGASVTFTASAGVFSASDVGRQLWRKSVTGVETGRAEITAYTSATEVTCEILEAFDSTDAIPAGEWYLTAGGVTGLDHLEGYEVTVVTDGGQHPKRTVVNGAITLDAQASVVHVGLGYNGWLETNDLEGGGTNGPTQTKKKSLVAMGIRFLTTLYARYGCCYYNLNQVEVRTAQMKMDRPPLPITGDVKEIFANNTNDAYDGGWSRSKRVIINQNLPFPCNVQLLIPYTNVSNI